jgi:hypothetical protein
MRSSQFPEAGSDEYPDELPPGDAVKIHAIILASGDAQLIAAYNRYLAYAANERMGMHGHTMTWHGTEFPPTLQVALKEQFGENYIPYLESCVVLNATGTRMELGEVTRALPDETLLPYFEHDYRACAENYGGLEAFKTELKPMFRGTVGIPGEDNFGVLLDAGIKNNFGKYSNILGLGMLIHPYTSDEIAEYKQIMQDEPEVYAACYAVPVGQAEQVIAKGIAPESVFLISAQDSPRAVQVLAEILNFQGASHYLPKEQKKN